MSTLHTPAWSRPGTPVRGRHAGRSFIGTVVAIGVDTPELLTVYVETPHSRVGEPVRFPVVVDRSTGRGVLDYVEVVDPGEKTRYTVDVRKDATTRSFTFDRHSEAVAFGQGISHGLILADPAGAVTGELGDYTAVLSDGTVVDISLVTHVGTES